MSYHPLPLHGAHELPGEETDTEPGPQEAIEVRLRDVHGRLQQRLHGCRIIQRNDWSPAELIDRVNQRRVKSTRS